VTTTAASSGNAIRAAKDSVGRCACCSASKLVRFDTGSSRLAVFASHTTSSANGSIARPRLSATLSTTGVSSTAVVSKLIPTVVRVARAATSRYSHRVEPRAARAHRLAAVSNTPAASASSDSTVIATRKPSTGAPRVTATS